MMTERRKPASRETEWWPVRPRIVMAMCVLALVSVMPAIAQEQTVTLAQCVEQALSAGPDIRISKATLGIAQTQYTAAAAANNLGLNGSLAANRSPATTGYSPYGTALQGVTLDTFQGSLSLSAPFSTAVSLSASHSITEASSPQQITTVSLGANTTVWDGYPGGQALATVQQAALALQGTQSSESSNQKNIIYQVKQAYYTLLGQQRQISILQQTLAQRQEEMKKTQALYDAQSANQIDLKQAQVNQVQAQLDLAKAQDTLEVNREQLSAVAGWPLDKVYAVAETQDLQVPALSVEDAVKTALANREDLRQLQLSLKSGEVSLALKKAQASPAVSLNTGVNVTEDWTASANQFAIKAGVSVQSPIIDPGSIGAEIQQAALQNDKLRIQQDQLAENIATSVKSAVYTLRDLLARVDLAAQSLDLAQSQYDLTRLQFDSGVSSNLDVLTASVALTTAQVNLAAARSAAQLAVLALQNAMGN
ncbi:MAG: TolC family protein [Spirochaetia bacterium]